MRDEEAAVSGRLGPLAVAAAAAIIVAVGLIALTGGFSGSHRVVVRVVSTGSSAVAPQQSLSGGSIAPDPRSVTASTPAPATAAPQPAGIFRSGSRASFARLRSGLSSTLSVAAAPVNGGSVEVLGDDTPAPGWSTTKVPVLAALLHARGSQGLSSQEGAWAQLAITQSDNQSILNLFGDLERMQGGLVAASSYVQQLLRASGDGHTIVATAPPPPGGVTTFGQTAWSPSASVQFIRALGQGCLLSSGQTSYVLGLMQNIESSESWGLGSAGFSSPVAFKGGWGPTPSGGYVVRQIGIIDPGSNRATAVAILAIAPSFGAGTQALTTTAQWLRGQLVLATRENGGCAGG